METHKKHLKASLLSAHQERSSLFGMFGSAINDTIKSMSTLQKSLVFGTLTLVVIVGAAGIFGPSVYSVAHAQAQETINRAFFHLANLTDEERANLEEKFQEGMHVKFGKDADDKFLALKDISPEEIEAHHEQIKVSLTDSLAEAQAASDLQIISADELPVTGFFGRAGRAFGIKMMHKPENLEDKLINLPEDVRQKIEEHASLHEEMKPVSFMVYTNTEGQTVYLGLNTNDEPVVMFVAPEERELPSPRGLNDKAGKMMFRGMRQSAE